VTEMPKTDKRGAFDAFSLEWGAHRRPTICHIAVFGVSYCSHGQFHERKAALAWMWPAFVALYRTT